MPRELFTNEPLKKKSKLNYSNNDNKFFTSCKMPTTLICDNKEDTFVSKLSKKLDEAENEVKYLETPTKSANDKKEYRVIQLNNGLTALLIADHDSNDHNTEKLSTSSSISSSSDEESSSENEDLSESEEDDEETDDIRNSLDKMKNDGSDKGVKMAACGLCVGVGSFSDPPEIPGLAHFLEHMVFMGSEKYPRENDFDSFIQKCGGFDNASTEPEHTTFYFEIVEKHLFSALDRFSQFFVAPLMLRDAITREREAVESEFQMALPSDFHRKEQLFCSLAKPHYPATKFTWGNLTTLRDNITEDELYKKLHEFRVRHYSAHRMTLAIQAKLPLDTLEEYVKKCFSNIPSNNLPSEDFSEYVGTKSFETHEFPRIYKIKPIKDFCQVELTWVMPPLHHLYKIKPHHYISWILGHEGKGSLINYLRKKMWCLDILCGNAESGFEHSSMYALFSLSLILTNDGYAHLKEILDAVFSYINMMRKFGPQKRIYDEIQAIENINFKFIDDVTPIDYVEDLCEKMQFYSPIDYITGGNLYFEYDPVAIEKCMNLLTPESMNIIIFNKQYQDEILDKTEVWFKTKYTDEEIPKEWVDCWKEIKPFKEFHLPEVNIYLTDDFTLIPINNEYKFPQKIYRDNLYELWYKPDPKFRLPECYMNFQLICPLTTTSPKGAAMSDLMVMTIKHLLVEELYPATAAELKYDIRTNERGFVIAIYGFNQKLPLLFKTIITYMVKCSDLVTEDLFRIMKSEQSKKYYNNVLKPSKLEKFVRLSILKLTNWTAIEKYEALNNTSFEEFKHFIQYFPKHVYIQGLVEGNISKDDVIKTVLETFGQLNCGPLLPNTIPQVRIISLPKGACCCRLKNFNSTDANSLVTNYYQSDLKSINLSIIIELILMLMEEPLFNELRTQQQLGYDVSCLLRETHGVLGYSVTVCTQANKFTTDEIDNKIEQFLKCFNDKLNTMSCKEFENVKEALGKIKQVADIHLKEEVVRNWMEIISEEYLFDRVDQEIDQIKKTDFQLIKDWFKEQILNENKSKKLSIHVIGSAKKNCSEEIHQNENNIDLQAVTANENVDECKKLVIEYLNDYSNNHQDSKLTYDECITDIEKFKRKHYTYPVYNVDT